MAWSWTQHGHHGLLATTLVYAHTNLYVWWLWQFQVLLSQ